jgi:hypothetical protein
MFLRAVTDLMHGRAAGRCSALYPVTARIIQISLLRLNLVLLGATIEHDLVAAGRDVKIAVHDLRMQRASLARVSDSAHRIRLPRKRGRGSRRRTNARAARRELTRTPRRMENNKWKHRRLE